LHITLLNNTRAISITIRIVVRLPFEVEFKPSLPRSRAAGHPAFTIYPVWQADRATRPITFETDVGACEAEFDFSGLKIDRLDMDLGASSVDVDFRKANPVRMHKMSIDVGASQLTIIGLGNANFDRLSFDGGVGDFTLDFSGELKRPGHVDIDVGLGSLTIRLPEDAGVEINSESSFLSSFSIDKREFDEVEDDVYQNDNFGQTDKELIFNVDIGLGSIDIESCGR